MGREWTAAISSGDFPIIFELQHSMAPRNRHEEAFDGRYTT